MYLNKDKYSYSKYLLKDFIVNKLKNYDQYRNYDYGLESTFKNVSGLSPYISRGILKEVFILNSLKNISFPHQKFKQEILWRTYWKGWLENHSNVWENYNNDLINQKKYINSTLKKNIYKKALYGETDIEPFNYWLRQLKSTGYLHNHARMWFASIWVHFLSLPWALGAKLFYENLLDADSASNTLSWRWVAGLQTIGKKYIVSKENIKKYTLGRFNDFHLPSPAKINISTEEKEFKSFSEEIFKNQISHKNIALLVTENNLNFEFVQENRTRIKSVILLITKDHQIQKSKLVKKFQSECNKDFINLCKKNNIPAEAINLGSSNEDIFRFFKEKNIVNIYSEYLTIGYEKDNLISFIKKLKVEKFNYFQVIHPFYRNAWQYCIKGYFNFKKNFDKI